MLNVYENIWASLIVLTREIIAEARSKNSGADIRLFDWEASAMVTELPDTDLMGPTALTITEVEPEIFEVTFAIASSTYSQDASLFRQRSLINTTFERLRYENKVISVFKATTGVEDTVLKLTSGTMVAPMSYTKTRPFQYVQAVAFLVPTSMSEED